MCATDTTSSLASVKSKMVLPFWCRLTQVVPEKRPLNGCSVVVLMWRKYIMTKSHQFSQKFSTIIHKVIYKPHNNDAVNEN